MNLVELGNKEVGDIEKLVRINKKQLYLHDKIMVKKKWKAFLKIDNVLVVLS